MTKRTSYTKEFKLEVIPLLEAGDKLGTQIARAGSSALYALQMAI
jgi:transposase-like protein